MFGGLADARGKLKRTTTVDKSGLIGDVWTPEYLAAYQNAVLDVNLETWYPLVREATFATTFVPLALADAHALLAHYEALRPDMPLPPERLAPLPPAPDSWVRELGARVQAGIDALGCRAVFAKTSSRSPKDAAASDGRMRVQYRIEREAEAHRMESSRAVGNEKTGADASAATRDTELNARVVALLRAGLAVLRVETGAEVVALLLRSERVYQDLLMAVRYPERFVENIVLREWVALDVGLEFRAFVVDARLAAVSQYCTLAYFPAISQLGHARVVAAICEAFDAGGIARALAPAFERYVIDFALVVLPDGGIRVHVIELNPYAPTTDPALFHWERDADVLAARAPFEFRALDAPPAGVLANLAPDWRDILTGE